ncbi:MAG: hypothetical protein KDB18_09975, partial [Salinibacterium sp.]|nr:hypothetical protein [Salinibacterium sp.]
RQAQFVIVFFLATLATVLVYDARQGVYARWLEANPPRREALLSGRWAQQSDAYFEEHSAFMRTTRPWRNEWLLSAFRETPPEVVLGPDDWLFLRESFQPMGPPGRTTRWHEMHGLAQIIEARFTGPETRYLVCVMPAKWRLYPEHMPDYDIDPGRVALYDAAMTELQARGLTTIDLLSIMRGWKREDPRTLLFAPNDTHFSEAAFAKLAVLLADRLCGEDPGRARHRLELLPREAKVFAGDLPRNLQIRPDSSVGRRFAHEERRFLAPTPANDESAEILVLGDSFFLTHDGIFQRLIQVAAQKPVDARYAGWQSVPVGDLMATWGQRPPRYLLLAVTEL